jgi:transcriptional regulator GlxA family with amidase domain
MYDDAILGFIKSQAKNCSYILSVCTGAFILAHAELLRGKRATTHHKAIEELTNSNLVGEVVRSKRFVVDGQVITTAGVTAGIDGALETVKRSLGQGASSKISKIIEYEGQE